jgi:hypothetical protein
MEFIQFVSLDKSGDISISTEAMNFLGSLPSDQKLAIVTVFGPIQSGQTQLASAFVGANAA